MSESGGLSPRAAPWRRRAVVGLYLLLGLIAAVEVGRDLASPGDYTGFVAFGTAAAAGQLPYDPSVEAAYLDARWATWPPSFAPIALLLARLDAVAHEPAVLLFQLANLLALALVLAILARWLYGRRLTLGVPTARGPDAPDSGIPLAALPVLGALLVPLRLVLANFEHAQSNLLVLGLAVGGMWLLARGRRPGGGLALGLATAFKATPLLLLGYLAWRGRWRDLAAAAAGCAVTWLALPALLLGPGRLGSWYGAWLRKSAGAAAQTSPLNQSLLALVERLAPGAPGWPVFLAVAAVLVGVGLWALGRTGRAVSGPREALEVAVVLAAMSLLSPLAWKAHYVTLVPLAAALLALTPAGGRWRKAPPAEGSGLRDERRGSGRALYAVLAAAFLAINLTSTGVVGRGLGMRLEAGSVVTWSALVLAGAGLTALARRRPA
jgi:hypothetical protein